MKLYNNLAKLKGLNFTLIKAIVLKRFVLIMSVTLRLT